MPEQFDTAGFYAAIDAVRQARGVTWYAIFRATYYDGCMSARKRANRTPDVPARTALARWAGIDASAYERKAVEA